MKLKELRKKIDEYGGPKISRADYLKKGKEYHSNQSQAECASEDDFKPHMMYDPKTGKAFKANKYADHVKYDKMGFTHDKPKVNEAIDFFKTSKALSDYAKKSGGIDKRDFEKAAAYVREIGKNSSTMVQNKAFMGLKKHVSNMDTDPRDGVLSILKKHGMFKNGRLMQEQAEVSEAARPPKIKKGLRDKKGKLHTVDMKVDGSKLSFRVTDEFGSFKTVNAKQLAKMFESTEIEEQTNQFARKVEDDQQFAMKVQEEKNCGCGKTPCETYGITEKKAGHMDQLRDIVKNKQAKKVNGIMVDMFTASAITQIYDKVNDQNKKRMDGMTVPALADVAYKMMKKR